MCHSRPVLFVLSLLLALGMTAGAYRFDQKRFESRKISESLTWARQIATQAEGLAMNARKESIVDPMGWAVGFLAQGIEPRIMQITKVLGSQPVQEAYLLDKQKGVFEYTKISLPEVNTGIRIRISVPFRGFLDARSRFGDDVTTLAFLLLSWLAIVFAVGLPLGWQFHQRQRDDLTDAQTHDRTAMDEPELPVLPLDRRIDLAGWALEARHLLTGLGMNVREILRSAARLAHASARSHDAVTPIRERIHVQLREIRTVRKILKNEAEVIQLVNLAVKDCFIEENRKRTSRASLGEGDKTMRMSQIAFLLETLKKTNQLSESAIRGLEIGYEPMVTDADIAFESHSDVVAACQTMNEFVTRTKSNLIEQARQMQSLLKEVESSLPRDEAIQPEQSLSRSA